MKYKEVKKHYESGELSCHFFEDENGNAYGEYRRYHENGNLMSHSIRCNDRIYGDMKLFTDDGTLRHHCLMDGNGNELASVIEFQKPDTHSEEQLNEIAKEHDLPLVSELPKTESEVTLWHIKNPDCPCLPIESE